MKDIKNSITKKRGDESFKWDVYQRAKIPEIRQDSKFINENLSFNSTNQQLIIPYRRGASSEGNRNKEEELMITISNIPDGYTIAKEINGVYESVGATDAFGTTTLFSVPKSNKTSEQLAKFELLNKGNLYLVASHKHAINLKNNSEMRMESHQASKVRKESIRDQRQ